MVVLIIRVVVHFGFCIQAAVKFVFFKYKKIHFSIGCLYRLFFITFVVKVSSLLAFVACPFFLFSLFVTFFSWCCKCYANICIDHVTLTLAIFVLPACKYSACISYCLWKGILSFQQVVFHRLQKLSIFLSVSLVHRHNSKVFLF